MINQSQQQEQQSQDVSEAKKFLADHKAKKIKVAKTLFNKTNYKTYTELVRAAGLPYAMIRSRYTLKIVSDFCNIHFITNVTSTRTFAIAADIKRDCQNCGIEYPEIDKDSLLYFSFNIAEVLNNAGGEVIYNIDIKHAYASVLRNMRIITPETSDKLTNLSKQDRLAAVGTLAAKKRVFYYPGSGADVQYFQEIKDTENWFYVCVDEVQKLMLGIKEILQGDFLMYWVDGVFFTGLDNIQKVMDFLTRYGYAFSFDVCTNFKYYEDNSIKELSYTKEGKVKKLCLPKENRAVDHFLLKTLGVLK